jgi:CRP-like cAMP-binding protein
MLLKVGDDTSSFFIVEKGCLEVFTVFDGNEFVIETLKTGSVLNYRVVFTDDTMMVNIRATQLTYMLEYKEELFENIKEDDPVYNKKLMMF